MYRANPGSGMQRYRLVQTGDVLWTVNPHQQRGFGSYYWSRWDDIRPDDDWNEAEKKRAEWRESIEQDARVAPTSYRDFPTWCQPSDLPLATSWPPRNGEFNGLIRYATGWPMLALHCDVANARPVAPFYKALGAITVPYGGSGYGDNMLPLPIRPIWIGALANTLAYAAVWLPLLSAPSWLLRTARRRRGLCPRCSYDLRSTPHNSPCPECGTPRPPQ